MTAIQPPNPSQPPAPVKDPLAEWWMTVSCQKAELWQNLSNKDTGKIYRAAWWKTGQILKQLGDLLMLLILSIGGVFVGLWLFCFYKGRELREKLEEDPSPNNILLKLLKAWVLDPCDRLIKWFQEELKLKFNWTLPAPTPKEVADDYKK